MPHYTRKGDAGDTGLWGGERVPKHHQQPETLGAIDEASSALGMARALAIGPQTNAWIQEMQQRLYLLMAEVAVAAGKPVPEDFRTQAVHVDALEAIAAAIEAEVPPPTQFVLPGETVAAGALDLARTIIRRAEREASRLQADGYPLNPEVLRYLNRASSVIFDLARVDERRAGRRAPRAARRGEGRPTDAPGDAHTDAPAGSDGERRG